GQAFHRSRVPLPTLVILRSAPSAPRDLATACTVNAVDKAPWLTQGSFALSGNVRRSSPQLRTRRVTSALAFHRLDIRSSSQPKGVAAISKARPKSLFRNILRLSLRRSRFCRGQPESAPSKFFE